MSYSISYMQRGEEVGSEIWKGSLEEAQDLARRSVDDGDYDRVEIRDEKGQYAFGYPRTLSSAR